MTLGWSRPRKLAHGPERPFEEVRAQRSFDESSLPRTGLLGRLLVRRGFIESYVITPDPLPKTGPQRGVPNVRASAAAPS